MDRANRDVSDETPNSETTDFFTKMSLLIFKELVFFGSQMKIRFEQIQTNSKFNGKKKQDSQIKDWLFDLMNKFVFSCLDFTLNPR